MTNKGKATFRLPSVRRLLRRTTARGL